jgi:uncharacterized protein (TIGR03083 family)
MGDPSIDHLGAIWASIGGLCQGLSEEEWALPTSCPGWSVQDHLSHLAGIEALLLGRPQPSRPVTAVPWPPSYVHNDLGEANEAAVEFRRPWAGAQVLEEFLDLSAARLEVLREMSDEALDEESWTPIGPGTVRDLLAIRAFDTWVHEQDMREALRRPGDLDTPAARHALDRCFLALPYVVGKRAAAPEGSTVVFEVTGATTGTLAVGVTDGRAAALDAPPGNPTTGIRGDFVTITRLCCGRVDPAGVLERGEVAFSGDADLGRRVVECLSFMI